MVGSLRSVSHALDNVFSNETAASDSLDEGPLNVLLEYIEHHSPIDTQDSSKLQDELARIHRQHVKDNVNKEPLFLRCLQELVPCLINADAIRYWFAYYNRPAIESAGYHLQIVKAARSFFLAVMTRTSDIITEPLSDRYISNSSNLAKWILDIYLGSSTEWSFTSESIIAAETEEERQRFVKMNAKNLLIQFGFKRTKELLLKLNEKFVLRKYRMETLVLLSIFVGQQPPYLYLIESTPLLDNLLVCLLRDISSSTLSICCTTLAMILPHVCNYMASNFVKLLTIYGRLASWRVGRADYDDQDLPHMDPSMKNTNDHDNEPHVNDEDDDDDEFIDTWQVQGHLFEIDQVIEPYVDPLFIILYGLFPANLMKFLRGPKKYLTAANYELNISDFWEESDIVQHSLSRVESFTLNPIFMQLTAKQELKNTERFQEMGSVTDIATYCLQWYNPPLVALQPTPFSKDYKPPFIDVPSLVHETIPQYSYLVKDEKTDADEEDEQDTAKLSVLNTRSPALDSLGPVAKALLSPATQNSESPALQGIDTLLDQHHLLYSKREGTPLIKADPLSSIPETLSLDADPSGEKASARTQDSKPKTEETKPSLSKVFGRQSSVEYSPRIMSAASPGLHPQGDLSLPEVSTVNAAVSPALDPLTRTSSNQVQSTSSSSSLRRKSLTGSVRRGSGGSSNGAINVHDSQLDELQNQLSYYKRELMLLKNELEFVTYIEYHSQYRYKKLKEKMTKQIMSNERIDHVMAQNKSLKAGYQILRQEAEKSRKSSQLYRNERQAYEGVLVNKNKEFRGKIKDLTESNTSLESKFQEMSLEKEKWLAESSKKDHTISELELQASYEMERAQLADTYLEALNVARNEVAKLRSLPASEQSTVQEFVSLKSEYSNLVLELEEAQQMREAMETDLRNLRTCYEAQIADMRGTIQSHEAKSSNKTPETSGEVLRLIQDFRDTTESQYLELKESYDSLAKKYAALNTNFQERLLEEDSRRARLDEAVPIKKATIQDQEESTSPINGRAHTMRMMVRQPTETRIRGRGGVQNASTSSTASSAKAQGKARQNFRGMHI